MLDVFGSLKSIVKTKEVRIDSHVSKLHYKLTVLVLLGCSLVVTSKQYIGEPIACVTTTGLPARLIDTYCWIHSTFTLPRNLMAQEIPAPGVDKSTPGDQRVYHKYYQWVCFMLFFQALLFYLPRYLWKSLEHNRVQDMMVDLNHPIATKDEASKTRAGVVDYLSSSFGHHKQYALGYYAAVVLNMVNVSLQIWLMDWFLGGEFSRYGLEVTKMTGRDQEERSDPMIRVFPRLTKCTFHAFGPSGDVMKHDALCVLPLNIVNEKSYVFLWFWFVILSFITGLYVIYCALNIFSRRLRIIAILSRHPSVSKNYLTTVIDRGGIGDWLLLYLLGKNLDSLQYNELISELGKKLIANDEGKRLITS